MKESLTFQVEHHVMSRWECSSPFLVSHWKAWGLLSDHKRMPSRTMKWSFSEREYSVSPVLHDSSLPKYLQFWALSTFSTESMKWWSLLPAKLLLSFVLDFGKKRSGFLSFVSWLQPLVPPSSWSHGVYFRLRLPHKCMDYFSVP